MIKQKIYIEEYDWTIYAFFYHSHYDVDNIMERLWDAECDSATAFNAYDNLMHGGLNTGLCYSNYRKRISVFVVAKTTSACQFANSWHHEMTHLQSHIAKVFDLDPLGEPIAYLTGHIAMQMYPKIGHLLCEECRSASCSH